MINSLISFRIVLFFMALLLAPQLKSQTTLSKPQFSLESGFYNADILLSCSCDEPDADLRYTTDGSIPTVTSNLYTVPFSLASRVGEENTISEISTGYDFTDPDEVFKGHVITARCFKAGFAPSKSKANTYFIGENITERYESLAIISLIADEANFFDFDTGIYILGANEAVCQLDVCGNYGQRGDDWEREVHFEFWESSENELAISRQLGVRIHGGATRNFSQKALRFYARDQYGKKNFEYPLFGDEGPATFKRFMLRAGGNDIETKMRDAYHQQFFTGTGVETQLYRPCVLFINGEFWGYHGIRESYNKHYFDSYYDIDKEDIDYISEAPSDIVDGGVQADEGDLIAFDALLAYIAANDISLEEGYNYVKNEVNIQSLATIYIAEMFVGNQDWPGNNVKLWRPRDQSRKWEWCLVDTDISGSGILDVADFDLDIPPGEGSYTEPIILAMLTNEEFRNFYINRWADLLNTRLLATNTGAKLDAIQTQMTPIVDEQSQRWFTPFGLDDWEVKMIDQKTWMAERVPVVWEALQDYYEITKANITLDVSNVNHGSIKCNSIPSLELQNYPWEGAYFEQIQIKLTAVNKPGYRFVNWTGGSTATDRVIFVNVTDNMNITAVFEPLPQKVVINELLASNTLANADPAGEYEDWIELFNNTNSPVDLSGHYLSNEVAYPNKWKFPEGTKIGAYSYLIIWADKDGEQEGLHASFKLNKAKGQVVFSDPNGTILDEASFVNQTKNNSWGRYVNATGSFINMNPTLGEKNTSPVPVVNPIADELIVFPNPADSYIIVKSNGENTTPLKVFNTVGELMFESSHQALVEEQVDITNWASGVYLVCLGDKVQKLIVY